MNIARHPSLDFEKKAFYTTDEVADVLCVHVSIIYEWIRTGRLFAYRPSEKTSKIPLTSLMEMLGESQPVVRRVLTPEEDDKIWASNDHPATSRTRVDIVATEVRAAYFPTSNGAFERLINKKSRIFSSWPICLLGASR